MVRYVLNRIIPILVVLGIGMNLFLLHQANNVLVLSQKQENLQDYGSYKMANWYGANKTPGSVKINVDRERQLASLGNFGKNLLASAGLVISPLETTVEVVPGMRREEIAELLAAKLNWTQSEMRTFAGLEKMCYWDNHEGELLPGLYTLSSYASPNEVKELMLAKFQTEIDAMVALQNSDDPLVQTAIKVASLLQREAAGDGDERIIAGIIWNRLSIDMKLQLDATLQYAKGEPGDWWPIAESADKYLDSDYNTYQNYGLPPTPIANPSPKMIMAALNPEPTDCFYYLHANRKFYCSNDYSEHKRNIRRYL